MNKAHRRALDNYMRVGTVNGLFLLVIWVPAIFGAGTERWALG